MARQAIVTKFFGPTKARRSRIKATAQAGSVYVEYAHDLSAAKNHQEAALALAQRFEWAGQWREAFLPDGSHVFICEDEIAFTLGRRP